MSVEEPTREGPTYEELHIIGRGAYGMVYKARDRRNKTFVALKKVRVSLNDDGVPMNTLREITLLKQLEFHNHPNIVKLLDICHGQRTERELIMYLVFEHVDQDLASFINQYSNSPFKKLSNWQIRNICKEILDGVDFLHSLRIVHRDLKPQNILITETGRIKLADFGLAKTYDFEMRLTSVVVTLWYRSPEVLLSLSYATPVDIWSVGCIMAELYMLKPLFCGSSEGDQLYQIFQVLGKPPENEWPEASNIKYNSFQISKENDLKSRIPNLCENGFDLLMRMLAFDPNKRISAEKALQHVYFHEEPLNT